MINCQHCVAESIYDLVKFSIHRDFFLVSCCEVLAFEVKEKYLREDIEKFGSRVASNFTSF